MIRKDKNENTSPAKDNVPPVKGEKDDKDVAPKKPATDEVVPFPPQAQSAEEQKTTSKK